jgi:hypothetical protein
MLVVLALVLSTQGLLLVQGTFLLRQDFVVQNLCVNRDRPELHCDGKCFLRQQLREQQQREDERNAASLEVMLAVGSLLAPVPELSAPPVRTQEFAVYSAPLLPSLAPSGVFHPPRG